MSEILLWITGNQEILITIGLVSAVVFFASLVSLPWLVAMIPTDYFMSKKRQSSPWKEKFPAIWLFMFIGKNIIGYLMLFAGALMLFLPGQGLLTMVAGLLMVDYPGKFSLERRIALTPSILSKLNWLRSKAKKPPLQTEK
ncbi:MAG: Uncharacterised protein [Porticoccaceae bacterium UBA1117]|jgi:archaellum biogenesis protein FlaJ (TadC family)|nr:MAG: Uncharacterised protein [Porticoccaceae bacterium UBA1117]